MIPEEAFRKYGVLVASAADGDPASASWEHVTHQLLAIIEAQDEQLDGLAGRIAALEADVHAAVPAAR